MSLKGLNDEPYEVIGANRWQVLLMALSMAHSRLLRFMEEGGELVDAQTGITRIKTAVQVNAWFGQGGQPCDHVLFPTER